LRLEGIKEGPAPHLGQPLPLDDAEVGDGKALGVVAEEEGVFLTGWAKPAI